MEPYIAECPACGGLCLVEPDVVAPNSQDCSIKRRPLVPAEWQSRIEALETKIEALETELEQERRLSASLSNALKMACVESLGLNPAEYQASLNGIPELARD